MCLPILNSDRLHVPPAARHPGSVGAPTTVRGSSPLTGEATTRNALDPCTDAAAAAIAPHKDSTRACEMSRNLCVS